ncbi:hypothetical protein [Halococcus agarilyticus]|uniref:hypothetical protein n=1 Tax=Halococcus agarilyticus TaxID=1232219 RepID=UPI000AADFFD2|nr:hypothetical protein [Halococcus agarilyticus]
MNATETMEATATDVETIMGTATVADDAETATVPTRTTTTPTRVRRTTENVSAAFTITDYASPGDRPSDETATARFEPDRSRIVVTGAIFVETCGDPTLTSIRNESETIVVVVGMGRHGPSNGTTTLGCEAEAGTIDYEVTIAVDGDLPAKVEVVHRQGDDETFMLTR